jgi:hypothetical protein
MGEEHKTREDDQFFRARSLTPAPQKMTPVIYEVNTWVWLNELRAKYRREITLDNVPPQEWDAFANFHANSIWLMGIWKRSPRGNRISASLPNLQKEFRSALPDFKASDLSGSPYCIQDYVVEPTFGAREALAHARDDLKRRGLKLILDFVPNHVAPDHPWLKDHPEFFIQGTNSDFFAKTFANINGRWFAYGRDPYFPPWTDTIQLNAFNPALRETAGQTLTRIASQCDGVRCDMAMLLLNDVFRRTWGEFAGDPPSTEYWTEVIGTVRRRSSEFLFIAEAYWDLESVLQQLGFDYCYDKRLYDRLRHDDAASVRSHLTADLSYQNKLLRFLENHDEPRAAQVFDLGRHRAAATAIATLPGGKLYHDGQFTGQRVKLPVQLGRQPEEPVNEELLDFYTRLVTASSAMLVPGGQWQLLDCVGWPDNQSSRNILAWSWVSGEARFLTAINFSESPSQGKVILPWPDLANSNWKLRDLMTSETFDRDGQDMGRDGLFVDLKPWHSHVVVFER